MSPACSPPSCLARGAAGLRDFSPHPSQTVRSSAPMKTILGRSPVLFAALFCAHQGLTACARGERAPDKEKEEGLPAPVPAKNVAPKAIAADPAPDYLVPPTTYGESDLIRALLVDRDQVYFANLSDVFRVPLGGGPPVPLSKTPGMALNGQFVLWGSEERLLAQSPGESIFMESPKAGGLWKTFLDLGEGKVGGGRDATARILQGVGKSGEKTRATFADFDGRDFYWSLQKLGAKGEVLSSKLLSVSLAGGPAKVVLDEPGTISEVHRLGERLVFLYTRAPSPAALAEYERARKKDPYRSRPSGPSGAFVLTPGQGAPELLMPLSHILSPVILVGDDSQVILSGFEDGDFKRGGIFRVPLGGGAPEKVDSRALAGQGFVMGDSFVIAGNGPAENGTADQGEVAIVVPRRGGPVRQVSFLADRSTTHARALAGDVLLLSRYDAAQNKASIVKVPLALH